MKVFTILKDIVYNAFHSPATRNYPTVSRPDFPGTRGRLMIDEDKCIFCGICQRKCPSNAITVTRKPDQSWQFDQFKCILCAACVDACPKKCLRMAPRTEKYPDEQ